MNYDEHSTEHWSLLLKIYEKQLTKLTNYKNQLITVWEVGGFQNLKGLKKNG